MRFGRAAWIAVALSVPCTEATRADVIAITGFAGTSSFSGSGVTIGFEFSTSAAIDVTRLAIYTAGGVLDESHAVGIFDTSGHLAVSTAIGPGTAPAGSLDANGFEYASVAATLLAPGTYLIGAYYADTNDTKLAYATSVSTGAPITYLRNAISAGSSLSAPMSTFAVDGYGFFGPNFAFTVPPPAPVPEPSSLALGLAGLAALGLARRRPR